MVQHAAALGADLAELGVEAVEHALLQCGHPECHLDPGNVGVESVPAGVEAGKALDGVGQGVAPLQRGGSESGGAAWHSSEKQSTLSIRSG